MYGDIFVEWKAYVQRRVIGGGLNVIVGYR